MFEVKYSINPNRLSDNRLMLSWPKPNCTECEANSKECRWKNNSTKGEIECFDCKGKRKTIHIPKYIIFPAIGKMKLNHTFKLLFVSSCYGYLLYLFCKENLTVDMLFQVQLY
jgi:hypothetical protein